VRTTKGTNAGALAGSPLSSIAQSTPTYGRSAPHAASTRVPELPTQPLSDGSKPAAAGCLPCDKPAWRNGLRFDTRVPGLGDAIAEWRGQRRAVS